MVEKKKAGRETATARVRAVGAKAELPEDALGSLVKIKRTALGLTHDGLSDLTKLVDHEGRGISRTSIRGYELGTYQPGAREIRILSLALEVSPSWLLFGGQDEGKVTESKSGGKAVPPKFRWSDIAIPLISYSQLASAERNQVRELVETLYRLQVGEVRFRSLKAFAQDFVDTIQDAVRDAREHGNLNSNTMRAVLVDTAAAMSEKHGLAEAELLMVLIEPLLDTLGALNAKA